MSKKLKTYIVICFVIFLFGCKEKKEYEKPKWVERWDSVMTEARSFLDSAEITMQFTVQDPNERYVSIMKRHSNVDSTIIIQVSDSSQMVAYFENGKWEITDCKKSMEVFIHCMIQMQENIDKEREEFRNHYKETAIYTNFKNKQ